MSSGSLAMMLSRYRPEIDKADRLDALGFDFVDGPDAYGLGRQFLVDRVKALIPMPLVGFKLALLVVVEIEQELRVFVLRGGFGHPRFLLFQNRPHGSCLLLRPLGQRETGAFGEFPPTFLQVWEQLRDIPRRGDPELLLNHGIDAFGSRRQKRGFEEVEGLQLGRSAVGAEPLLALAQLAPACGDRDQFLMQSRSPWAVETKASHQDHAGHGIVALRQAGPGEVVEDEPLSGESAK